MFLYATASELARQFRSDVYDPLEGFNASEPDSENLWKNSDVYFYMTEAADAVARRTKQLTKHFSIAYAAGQAVVRISSSVLDIFNSSVSLTNGMTRLFSANINGDPYGVSDDYGNRTMFAPLALDVTGTPSRFIRDYEVKGNLRLLPIPEVADTLNFAATVTIAAPFLDGSEPMPFTEMPDISLMLKYMKGMAYLKQDADTLDERRSQYWFAEYERAVLERELEIRRIRHPVSIVRSCW